MQIKNFLRGVGLATGLAVASLAGAIAAHAQTVLPTGATITPSAAPGSVFQPLKVALPDYPNYSPNGAETWGSSLATSGFG